MVLESCTSQAARKSRDRVEVQAKGGGGVNFLNVTVLLVVFRFTYACARAHTNQSVHLRIAKSPDNQQNVVPRVFKEYNIDTKVF